MTGIEIFAIAGMELAKMLVRLFQEFGNGAAERMSGEDARVLARQIMQDVQLDEAIERRQFERLRAEEAIRRDADTQG
jgi:ABC-type uncharacterized transport system ATPase component